MKQSLDVVLCSLLRVALGISQEFPYTLTDAEWKSLLAMAKQQTVLGIAYRFPQLNLKVDISYGVYVYHMVVVNAFIALGLVNNLWYLPLVFVITFLIGYASTKTIGAFGIRKKTKAG